MNRPANKSSILNLKSRILQTEPVQITDSLPGSFGHKEIQTLLPVCLIYALKSIKNQPYPLFKRITETTMTQKQFPRTCLVNLTSKLFKNNTIKGRFQWLKLKKYLL